MALDGMKIIKIAAGGWHSAAISGEYKVKHEIDFQDIILSQTSKTIALQNLTTSTCLAGTSLDNWPSPLTSPDRQSASLR